MKLHEAQTHANNLQALLAPICSRTLIVGSVRREALNCKDIELLVEPLDELCFEFAFEQMLNAGIFLPRLDDHNRKHMGARSKRLIYKASQFEGIPFDLFICLPPAQFGVLAAIRTGPAEFSQALVTPRPYGLLPQEHKVKDGGVQTNVGQTLQMPEESDFLKFLGLANHPNIAPSLRHHFTPEPAQP